MSIGVTFQLALLGSRAEILPGRPGCVRRALRAGSMAGGARLRFIVGITFEIRFRVRRVVSLSLVSSDTKPCRRTHWGAWCFEAYGAFGVPLGAVGTVVVGKPVTCELWVGGTAIEAGLQGYLTVERFGVREGTVCSADGEDGVGGGEEDGG